MEFNIPSQIRGWLYIICVIGSIIVAYLSTSEIIGPNEFAAWNSLTAAIALIARFNLTPKE